MIYDPSYHKLKKKDLYEFVQKELDTNDLDLITGFPIGTEGDSYSQQSRRIFLVGDAAGFAETLLGEGIYNAVISGKYIGNALKDTDDPEIVCREYNKFLHGMKKELSLYNRGAKILYKKQRMSYWMLKLFIGGKFMNGYSNGETLTEIVKGRYPFPVI